MMAECMLKKTKQQSQFMGVLTRSKTLALQKERGEFLQLGSRSFKKQRRGDSLDLLKGKGKNGIGRKRKVEERVEKGGVKLEEGLEDKVKKGEGKDDLGRGNLVGSGVHDLIGADIRGGDAMIGGGVGVAAKGGVDGADAISGGGEGAEIGGDIMLGREVLKTGGSDRVTRESTPEHLMIRSDNIITPCSSTKGPKAFADERPETQTEVGGNSHQHKKLTTDFLLQENSNYAPSMEKYNFDFENEKPLPGRFEWEKVQP